MILGHVRDGFPRVMLTLPGQNGDVNVEFIVDTGFDGELAVPRRVLAQLPAAFLQDRPFLLADRTLSRRPVYSIDIHWDGQLRATEIIEMENPPLLGVQLMEGKFLQSEMTDGGEVSLGNL